MKKRLRHTITFWLLKPFIYGYLKLKYRAKVKKYKPPKNEHGPYLILSNHVLNWDPFLLANSFRFPIFYVASDMIFSIPFWSKVIRYLVSPIPKTKYRSDMETIRDMIKMVKSGGSVCIFPEGNATFHGDLMPIDQSIVKLVKLLKIPVVLYNIEGAYYSHPRWSNHVRKGNIRGFVKTVLYYDEYKDLNNDILYDLIIEHLTVDDRAYKESNQITYKSKALAEDIETAQFYCPVCHSFDHLITKNHTVFCSSCDFKGVLDSELRLKDTKGNVIYDTNKAWYDDGMRALEAHIQSLKKDDIIFQDDNEAVLDVIRSKAKTPIGQARLILTKTMVSMQFQDSTTISLDPNHLNVSVQQKNKLIIYDKERKKTYYLLSHKKRNAFKYECAVNLIKKGAN
ncbi:MAG: lysophospholipid acyltransferase family protein [Bacillota bacterium]